jgi:TonB family protein
VYFRALNGFEGGQNGPMDDELLTFWNLAELRPLTDEERSLEVPDGESYFVFADELMWSQAYALRLRPGRNTSASVWQVFSEEPVFVSPSLTEFLAEYLRADGGTPSLRQPAPPPPAPSLFERFRRLFVPWGEVKPRLRNGRAMTRLLTRRTSELLERQPRLRGRSGGVVKLRMRIGHDGLPNLVEVTAPAVIPELNDLAVEAGWRMRFAPAYSNRIPVTVQVELPITFSFR